MISVKEKINERLNSKKLNDLLKAVVIITVVLILFLIILNKFGGHITDKITEKTCNMVHEKYVPGKTPGSGVCVKK